MKIKSSDIANKIFTLWESNPHNPQTQTQTLPPMESASYSESWIERDD